MHPVSAFRVACVRVACNIAAAFVLAVNQHVNIPPPSCKLGITPQQLASILNCRTSAGAAAATGGGGGAGDVAVPSLLFSERIMKVKGR